jgi:hypothetical protein
MTQNPGTSVNPEKAERSEIHGCLIMNNNVHLPKYGVEMF